jgi:ATP-dependent Clp protease, protease subunit
MFLREGKPLKCPVKHQWSLGRYDSFIESIVALFFLGRYAGLNSFFHFSSRLQAPGSDIAQFVDINSAMYRDRTLMINKFIDEEKANEIISIILWMRSQDERKDISIYFNVPGALMRPSLAIYDLLEQTKQTCAIETVNLGLCAGMGAFLCAAGTKGKRSAMPNSRFLLQRTGLDQPIRGQATDIVLEVKNIKMWNDRVEGELSKLTGQPMEKIQNDLKRDFYLSSDEAVQYGLIDQVLLPAPLKRAARGQEADLGAFEGDEEQKYQNRERNSGGWGSQQPTPPRDERKDDDDDGPKIAKG